ncbi:SRC kinase signaling inhibitor 1-like isoform X3 [Hypanus sabinus]|nr:SRC kinase signaling inhibitor 1-like isoform X3 [Hypanus sabinus]
MTPMKHGSYNYKTTYNHPPVTQDSDKSSSHMISADDAEYPREYRTLGNGTRRFSNVGLVHTSERRHTVIAAQSLEALTGMQKSDMERKREAFLDHLKHKYPHHATAIRGQQERLREQQGFEAWSACEFRDGANKIEAKTRSPRHSQSQQSGLADQAAKLPFASAESLETMSEAEVPIGFTRSNRFRQSLPLSRSTSQAKLRSPGVLFLQFGEETRRVHITHEISSMDTLHALIVHMFPQKLTMGMLKSPNTAILIKDETRNIFYELEDVRDIQDRSIIKIFRKDPIYAPYPASHIANGDLRREMVYTSRESSPTRRLSSVASGSPHLVSASPSSGLQSSSPSRSRMSYSGGRPPSYTGSPVHHAERLGALPHSQPASPSPSAILERRDVKPDEDMGNKNVVLMKHESLYADPYSAAHEGRLSIASTQSLAGLQDPFSYPSGLYRRGSVRSLSTYSAAGLHGDLDDPFYKPSPPIYSDGYGTGLGYRMAPSSPQKIPDSRLIDAQQGQSPHSPYSGPSGRSPPVRPSFRKDPAPAGTEPTGAKPRNASPAAAAADVLPGPSERAGTTERPASGYSSPLAVNDPETRERMEAMEKQIASLTGLVQNALLRGNDGESASDKSESINDSSGTGTLSPSVRSTVPGTRSVSHPTAITRLQMQLHLHDLQQNAGDLRTQLQQLRKLQLQSQDTMKHMMKRLESEISIRVSEALRKQEDPLHRQRALVEEERQKYLNEEEMIVQQLKCLQVLCNLTLDNQLQQLPNHRCQANSDLEKSVDDLQRDAALSQRLITGPELEEKALVLRQLSETLTDLKAQFPSLQSKMRVILRVEVEAVKFLKEEPHRLDVLLKRCKTITDVLATLRNCSPSASAHLGEVYPRRFGRQPTEVLMKAEETTAQSPKHTSTDSHSRSLEFEIPTSPPLAKNWQNHDPSLAQFSQSSPAHAAPSQNPQGATGQNSSAEEVPAPGKRNSDRTVSVEAAERDWDEKRGSLPSFSNRDINRLLEETQAELMKAIPDLGFASKPKVAAAADQKQAKPQHAQKTVAKAEANGRRHSEELTVHKYRTEKPSKSPPPPPPRRSFPSSHGLTTGRTGEVIVTNKKETTLKKADSDETDTQRPHVKLRRTMSEARPPSTPPPIAASAIRDDEDEEDRIMAELEVFQRSPVAVSGSRAVSEQALLSTDTRSCRLFQPAGGWKEMQVPRSPGSAHIVLTKCKPSSSTSSAVPEPVLPGEMVEAPDGRVENGATAGGGTGSAAVQNQQNWATSETWARAIPARIVLEEFALLEADLVQDIQTQMESPSMAQENLLEISSSSPSEVASNNIEVVLSASNAEKNVAFMENQNPTLSWPEVQGIIHEEGEDIQTCNVSSSKEENPGDLLTPSERQPGEISSLSMRPVVAIFGEPLDIRTAQKRLSTVFEDQNEDFQMLMREKDSIEETPDLPIPAESPMPFFVSEVSDCISPGKSEPSTSESGVSSEKDLGESSSNSRTLDDTEQKDENSRDIRASLPEPQQKELDKGSELGPEASRKVLQVVVYEEEEKINTVTGQKQTEVKKLKVDDIGHVRSRTLRNQTSAAAFARTEEIRNSTYKTMDSLEETIRELESTISQISQHPCTEFLFPREFLHAPEACELRGKPVGSPGNDADGEPAAARGGEDANDSSCPKSQPCLVPSDSRKRTSPTTRVKPSLFPKPQLLPPDPKSGGRLPIPPAPKLKQQPRCEKPTHSKQRDEYLRMHSEPSSQQ